MQRVHMVFNVQPAPEERVVPITKKITKDYEIIDVNGFELKRRRVQNAENVAANDTRTPLHQQHGSTAAVGRTPSVDEYDIDEELYYRLTRNLQELPETAEPADMLTTICTSVCEAEVVKTQHAPEVGTAIHDVFTSFIASLRQATETGEIKFASNTSPADGEADLHVDLEARKAGLRARIAKFQQEEAEWKDLMDKVNQLDEEQNADLGDDGNAVEGDVVSESEEITALKKLKNDVHRRLAMQVDGVCLLVGDVEELVAKANKSAQTMQAEYHQEKFKTFAHVNSPAKLIKALLTKKPTAAE